MPHCGLGAADQYLMDLQFLGNLCHLLFEYKPIVDMDKTQIEFVQTPQYVRDLIL